MRWEGGRMLREEVEVDLDLEKGRVEGERKKRCHYRKMELREYLYRASPNKILGYY